MKRIILIINTIKYLKISQIFFQIYYRFFGFRKKITRKTSSLVAAQIIFEESLDPSFIDKNTICLLNEKEFFKNGINWNVVSKTKLWNYNLHYFNDLNAKKSSERVELQKYFLEDWIKNKDDHNLGWDPYPTSIRVVNLLKWYSRNGELIQGLDKIIYEHANHIFNNLEYHLGGNHLLTNAKALIFSGSYLNGKEGKKFFDKGIKLLKDAINEQFLKDGGHYERSPMYQNIIIFDLLDILNLLKSINEEQSIINNLKDTISLSLSWTNTMTHNDGSLTFFNDSCYGIAPKNTELLEYAERLGVMIKDKNKKGIIKLEESNFARANYGDFSVFIDIGEIGPAHLPGHAHDEMTSFELDYSGRKVFVNSGISTYENNDDRLFQRGARAHNCLNIRGLNSSEIWGSFRVARRAKRKSLEIISKENDGFLSCSHDGYRQHGVDCLKRNFSFQNRKIVIADTISKTDNLELNFYLHPMISARKLNPKEIMLEGDSIKLLFKSSEKIEILESIWNESFSKSIKNTRIKICSSGKKIISTIEARN